MNDPKKLASKGRYGDTMLAHINPEEAALLKARGGSGTINPKTGLPEFYGYYQFNQPNQATLDAQKAAEKAASGATTKTAPRVVETAEQRQARIARDLALSQIRGARPSSQDSQFYQPAYQPQYQNYGNPLTAFNVSNYGTNPAMSRSMQAATAPGASGAGEYYKQLQSYASLFGTQPDKNNINFDTLLRDMRQYGISAQDLQNASSYSPQMRSPFSYQQPMQQRQAPFNPYTNQYQTPFSYQQPQFQQQMQSPFSYQQPYYGGMRGYGGMVGYGQQSMQNPFSYQQSPAQKGSTPNQPAPAAMRRAEGGITSLLDNDE